MAIVGRVRGGLAMVSIGASMFFAEISGSAVADVSALGSIRLAREDELARIKDVAHYVRSLSGLTHDSIRAARGRLSASSFGSHDERRRDPPVRARRLGRRAASARVT